jgi:hypothetical protein
MFFRHHGYLKRDVQKVCKRTSPADRNSGDSAADVNVGILRCREFSHRRGGFANANAYPVGVLAEITTACGMCEINQRNGGRGPFLCARQKAERSYVWSKYAWKLTLKNSSDRPQLLTGTIEFQDSDGFIVDTSDATNMVVKARSENTFTGYALIRAAAAGKVARTVAKIGKER